MVKYKSGTQIIGIRTKRTFLKETTQANGNNTAKNFNGKPVLGNRDNPTFGTCSTQSRTRDNHAILRNSWYACNHFNELRRWWVLTGPVQDE
jgi:hypothetical protein